MKLPVITVFKKKSLSLEFNALYKLFSSCFFFYFCIISQRLNLLGLVANECTTEGY